MTALIAYMASPIKTEIILVIHIRYEYRGITT